MSSGGGSPCNHRGALRDMGEIQELHYGKGRPLEDTRLPPEHRARQCSKCASYFPVSSYDAVGGKGVCQTCSVTCQTVKKPERRITWAETLLCFSKYESRKIFHLHFRVREADVGNLPSTLEHGDFRGRLMPLNLLGTEMNAHNTVIVHKDAAEVLRKCIRTGNTGLYQCIMYHFFPDLVDEVRPFSRPTY